MKYFAVEFPSHNTYVIKTTTRSATSEMIVRLISSIVGFRGHEGVILNPKNFISVIEITNPNEKQQRVARDTSEVFI